MNICTTEFDVVCFCRSESRRGDEVVKQGTFFDSDHGEEEMYSIRSSKVPIEFYVGCGKSRDLSEKGSKLPKVN